MKKILLTSNKSAITVLMAIFLCVSGCSKKNEVKPDDDDTETGFVAPNGFGHSRDKPFEGTPFTLPSGVSFERIVGFSAGVPGFPNPDNPCNQFQRVDRKSEGDLVGLCLIFRNDNNKPMIVDFPPGVIFESEAGKNQHGITLQRA
jgi:hypothetical protein